MSDVGIEGAGQRAGQGVLKVILNVIGIVILIYGLGYFVVPDFTVGLSEDPRVPVGEWLRWVGGLMIGLAAGAFMVARDAEKQGPFVTMLAIGETLAFLALAYGWASGEYAGVTWYIAAPTIITLIFAIALWWARSRYKDVL